MNCPGQGLMSVTYPIINSSDRTPQPVVNITQHGVMNYTVCVKKGFHCASDIMIVIDDREVDMKSANFSKWLLVDVVCCVVFNLLILWPQVPIMFKTVMYPLTTPPY